MMIAHLHAVLEIQKDWSCASIRRPRHIVGCNTSDGRLGESKDSETVQTGSMYTLQPL